MWQNFEVGGTKIQRRFSGRNSNVLVYDNRRGHTKRFTRGREAEREVLKTVERLDMLPLLTAGNILRKDKEGQITYLNPGMESTCTLTDIGFEPDELDSIPVEELIEAESDILCSVAEEIDHSSAYDLSDIAASAQTSKTTQAELLEDEDDGDDPSQCHLYQSGTCK